MLLLRPFRSSLACRRRFGARHPPSCTFLAATFLSRAFSAHRRHEISWIDSPKLELQGGAVYDALVAAAALEHQLPLATRDRRAIETYRALGVELEILV